MFPFAIIGFLHTKMLSLFGKMKARENYTAEAQELSFLSVLGFDVGTCESLRLLARKKKQLSHLHH